MSTLHCGIVSPSAAALWSKRCECRRLVSLRRKPKVRKGFKLALVDHPLMVTLYIPSRDYIKCYYIGHSAMWPAWAGGRHHPIGFEEEGEDADRSSSVYPRPPCSPGSSGVPNVLSENNSCAVIKNPMN